MSGENKTLQETIGEAIKSQASVAEKGMSQDGASGETQSGETAEYASGIDISDIPEQDRPRIKELLSKKASLLEKGYQGKFQEVAKFKKAQEELTQAGLTVDEAQSVLMEHLKKKQSPATVNQMTEQKKEASKALDKLIADAPYEQRASLEQLRQIILEETNVSKLEKRFDDIEKFLGGLSGSMQKTRRNELSAEVDKLSEKYGKEFVEGVRDDIIDKSMKFNVSPKQVLFHDYSDEVEEAISVKKGKLLTPQKKNAISSNGDGVTTATEKIDIKNTSLKDIIMSAAKLKR